jgi:hypothetical protein
MPLNELALILTLSLRERKFGLPLPEGEGRGEGESIGDGVVSSARFVQASVHALVRATR